MRLGLAPQLAISGGSSLNGGSDEFRGAMPIEL
jgi:hypothetical protein